MKKLTLILLSVFIFCSSLLFVSCDVGVDSDSSTYVSDTNEAQDNTTASENGQTTENITTTELTTAEETQIERDPSKELSILFIGNSFTFYNDMPTALFQKICESGGYKVKITSVTNGGHYLSEFADPSDQYGMMVRARLAKNKYDIVILQEQSGCPIKNPGRFYDGVRTLAELIKANGAEIWLYETWGYKAGYSKLETHGGDTATMEMKLRAAYSAIADEVGAKVVYAGIAMLDVHTNNPAINVYRDDLFHPSAIGSSVVAYTFYATLFGEDPRAVSFNCNLPATTAKILKEAAYEAAFGDNSVDGDFKLSSEGVTQ